MQPTMSAGEAIQYLQRHQGQPPDGLTAVLRADFGADDGGGNGGSVDVDAIRARLEAIQAECDRDGLRYFEPTRGMTRLDMEAFARDIQRSLGLVYEHAGVALDALGKGNGEPVEPPAPPAFDSFGGSYPGHDPALDLYPAGESGPHAGHVFRCPVAGTVERFSFISPLVGRRGWAVRHVWGDEGAAYNDLAEPDDVARLLPDDERATLIALGTTMHIAVFRPAQPLMLENGQPCRALWIGHVALGFATGVRQQGDPLAVCSDSGIEFRNGSEAAHGHLCGSSDGSLSPNGTLSGALIARALGYNPRVTAVPGPAEYQSGRYFRGKPR